MKSAPLDDKIRSRSQDLPAPATHARPDGRGRRAGVFPALALALLAPLVAARTDAPRVAGAPARLADFLGDPAARPLLLHDEHDLLAYLQAFPRDRYALRPTANGFSFWIEKEGRLDGIKEIISRGGVWEQDNIELMRGYVKPGSVVVDAGAFIGTHTLPMSRMTGPAGRVYAFEPQKKIFRELVYNLMENDARSVVPLRFALGDGNRIIEMDKPTGGAEALVGVGGGGDRTELRTLDSFRLKNVSFIKIDVEDYERPLLEGARETLDANARPPILVEIMRAADYVTAAPDVRAEIEKTLGALEDEGYAVKALPHRDYLALPASEYVVGSPISFADSGNAGPFKSRFWRPAEAWGTWMLGGSSGVVLRLSRVPAGDLVLACSLRAREDAANASAAVTVAANGRSLTRWVVESGAVQARRVVIPAALLAGRGAKPFLRLEFRPEGRAGGPAPGGAAPIGDGRLRRPGMVGLVLRER